MTPGPARAPGSPVADPFFRPLTGYLVAFSTLQVLTLSLGVIEVPLSRSLALWILALSLISGAACHFLPFPAPSVRAVPSGGAWVKWTSIGIIASSLALIVLSGFAAYVAPDLSWDGNLYHLPTIQFWAQKGYVHWVDSRFTLSALSNGYPKGAELVAFVLVRALDDSQVVNMPNLLFLPLAVLAIASTACALSGPWLPALAAGCLFLLVPVNIYQAGSTYIDAAFASCLIAFLAAVVHFHTRALQEDGVPWSGMLSLASSAGLCLAVRSSGWLVMATIMGLLTWFILRARTGQAGFRGSALRFGFSFLVIAGALLVGGFWYARNLARTGSPLYPVGIRVGRFDLFPGKPLSQVIHPNGHAPREYRDLEPAARILSGWMQGGRSWPASVRGADARRGGLGFLWLIGCVPAIVWLLARVMTDREDRLRLRPHLLLVLLGGGIFLLTPINWWARYTVWVYGIGLPCLAWAVQEMKGSMGWRRLWTVYGLAVLCLWLTEGTICTKDVLGVAFRGGHPVSLAEILSPESWRWPANYLFAETRGTILDAILEGGDTVAVGPMSSPSLYGLSHTMIFGQLSMPLGRREIVPLHDPLSTQDLQDLRSRRVRYILWDGRRNSPLPEGALGHREVEIPGFRVLILPELPPAGNPPPVPASQDEE